VDSFGWEAGMANPEGDKPKGVHGRSFERLNAEYDVIANASWAGRAERQDKLGLEPLDNRGGMAESVW
jgi:hypothetical protein